MTTAWPKEPGGTTYDGVPGTPQAPPPSDPVLVAPVLDADPDGGDPPLSGGRQQGRHRRSGPAPRRVGRTKALLVLLVLPLSLLLTVAAMTLMLPTAATGRATPAAANLTGLRVQVMDGGADADLVRRVADRLAAAGVEVTTLGRAGGAVRDTTEIVYHQPAAREKAAEVQRVLRVGKVILDRSFSTSVEVTIIVGMDVRFG